jgi:hypothetical protein
MKSKKKLIVGIIVLCALAVGAAGTLAFYKSQSPSALKMKKQIKYMLLNKQIPKLETEMVGLGNVERVELYENNCLVAREKLDAKKDNKKIYITNENKRLVDYTKGYLVDLPKGAELDFSYSPLYTTAEEKGTYKATISREYSPYDDIDWYIDYYFHRFITSPDYQRANNVTMKEDATETRNGNALRLIDTKIENLDSEPYDGYIYVTIKTNTRIFYRIMVKYDASIADFKEKYVLPMLDSFRYFEPSGSEGYYDLDFHPEIPYKWTEETKEVYETISESDKIRWGIFAKDIYGEGINKTIPDLEQKIEYKFPVILSYLHFTHEFPTEFMQENYENGRLVELTYQVTESNNEKLEGYTPNIDIYRGVKDDEIRKIARSAKEFGHPFLFRLNNEMNSDWVSYGGVTNMSDPEIFIANWQRFYRIFEEEGANNVIWVFNPNDRNHPPCDWNNFLAYYPGNEYVQMIGVTGYNNGTYYEKERSEQWREFDEIYDAVEEAYKPFFSEFPWIITEFSSSSVGGDKVKWIENMFSCIDDYKNIKIAVWFDYADYDFREEYKGKVARPYWLDETPETTEAFRRGVAKNGLEGWR